MGTVQILIKQKRASKLFPSCFKVPSDKKRFCVYVWCFSVVVISSLSVAAGFYCACASVNNIRDLQLSVHVLQHRETKTLKDAVPQSLQINKTVWRSFKTKRGVLLHYASLKAASRSKPFAGPLSSPFSSTHHPPTSQSPTPPSPLPPNSNHVCLAAANHWWSPDCQQ